MTRKINTSAKAEVKSICLQIFFLKPITLMITIKIKSTAPLLYHYGNNLVEYTNYRSITHVGQIKHFFGNMVIYIVLSKDLLKNPFKSNN